MEAGTEGMRNYPGSGSDIQDESSRLGMDQGPNVPSHGLETVAPNIIVTASDIVVWTPVAQVGSAKQIPSSARLASLMQDYTAFYGMTTAGIRFAT